MKTPLFILLLLPVLFALPAAAQTPVKGQVTGEDNAPLSGARISVKSTTIGATTDAKGNYELQLEPGPYTLEAASMGHKSVPKPMEAGAAPLQVNFALSSEA